MHLSRSRVGFRRFYMAEQVLEKAREMVRNQAAAPGGQGQDSNPVGQQAGLQFLNVGGNDDDDDRRLSVGGELHFASQGF